MDAKLTFKYDREADILHIGKCPPYTNGEKGDLRRIYSAPIPFGA